jgi:Fe2+ or Zn2+ uptake regulation protein
MKPSLITVQPVLVTQAILEHMKSHYYPVTLHELRDVFRNLSLRVIYQTLEQLIERGHVSQADTVIEGKRNKKESFYFLK